MDALWESQVEPLAVDTPKAARMTGLGRSKLLELTYQGEISSLKVGRRRLFPVAALEAWVERKARESQRVVQQAEAARLPDSD